MSLYRKFNSGTSRGKTFIYIFIFDILICILSSTLSRLPVNVWDTCSDTASVRLALGVTVTMGLTFLDELPLWFHQITNLLASLRNMLGTSLNYICFCRDFWIGIAKSLT